MDNISKNALKTLVKETERKYAPAEISCLRCLLLVECKTINYLETMEEWSKEDTRCRETVVKIYQPTTKQIYCL